VQLFKTKRISLKSRPHTSNTMRRKINSQQGDS